MRVDKNGEEMNPFQETAEQTLEKRIKYLDGVIRSKDREIGVLERELARYQQDNLDVDNAYIKGFNDGFIEGKKSGIYQCNQRLKDMLKKLNGE